VSLNKTYRLFEKAVQWASKATNVIGAVFLTAMMLLIFSEVSMRYLFNAPIEGAFEMVEFMMALVISLAMAYTGIRGGHISVELLVSKFSKRTQSLLNIFHFLVCTVFFALMSWKTTVQALVVAKRRVTSQVLLIPVYPFVWVLAVCAGLLCLVFLVRFIDSFKKVVENE
jgi:TRAP-type C4-dicarboxylate transport system permease small subunit